LKSFLEMNQLYPEGLMAYERIGNVYYQTGKPDLSLKYYRMFLDREPENPRIKAIVEKIKEELENNEKEGIHK